MKMVPEEADLGYRRRGSAARCLDSVLAHRGHILGHHAGWDRSHRPHEAGGTAVAGARHNLRGQAPIQGRF